MLPPTLYWNVILGALANLQRPTKLVICSLSLANSFYSGLSNVILVKKFSDSAEWFLCRHMFSCLLSREEPSVLGLRTHFIGNRDDLESILSAFTSFMRHSLANQVSECRLGLVLTTGRQIEHFSVGRSNSSLVGTGSYSSKPPYKCCHVGTSSSLFRTVSFLAQNISLRNIGHPVLRNCDVKR